MDVDNETTLQELKPFYVYELRDPTANYEVFYVGKGTERRAEHHEKAALSSNAVDSKKIARIKKIHSSGSKHLQIVIGRYDTEAEAFAVEAALIHWVYGHKDDFESSTLTNIVGGHGGEFVRERDNLDSQLPGIDIPKQVRSMDGRYTNEKKARNERYSVKEKLEKIRSHILLAHQDWIVSGVDMTKPMSPSIYVDVFGVARVQCVLPGSGKDSVKTNLRARDSTKFSSQNFANIVGFLGDASYGLKNHPANPYCKLIGWDQHVSVEHSEIIISRIEGIRKLLEKYEDVPQQRHSPF